MKMYNCEVTPICVNMSLGAANLGTQAATKLPENSHTRQIRWRGIFNKLYSQF